MRHKRIVFQKYAARTSIRKNAAGQSAAQPRFSERVERGAAPKSQTSPNPMATGPADSLHANAAVKRIAPQALQLE